MYRVIDAFHDLTDDLHAYAVGDRYPRKGHTPTPERIEALAGCDNIRRAPLIEQVADAPAAAEKKPRRAKEMGDGQ